MKLSDCTSSICTNYNCDYCPECSHAIYRGWGKDSDGGWWRWQFQPRFGPLFLDKNGEPLEEQPDSDLPIWDAFQRWIDRINGKDREPLDEQPDEDHLQWDAVFPY